MRVALIAGCAMATWCWSAPAAQPGAKSAHVPRSASLQWEITFEENISTEEYARQLDYFHIELGAVSSNGRIDYLSKLSSRKPVKRVGSVQTEYRLPIGWRKGNLYNADRRLLTRAAISPDKKELLHYFPTEVEARLAELQQAYANRDAREIRRTRYALREKTKGDGYEFVVIEQDPPRPTASQPASASKNPNTAP
jgi:hypothetical protein